MPGAMQGLPDSLFIMGCGKDVLKKALYEGLFMKILVPLDSSEYARKNVDYVKGLAKKLDAEVVLLNVQVIPAEVLSARGEAPFRKDGEEFLEVMRKQLEGEGVKASTRVEVATYAPAVEIVKAAVALKVDMIALGAKGSSLKRNILIGSVADSVVKNAPCPVLMIR
jgi:universal stress protein A